MHRRALSLRGGGAAKALAAPGLVTDSLISEWRFDDGSGSTVNDYAGANDGTFAGGTLTWTSEGLQFSGGWLTTPYSDLPDKLWVGLLMKMTSKTSAGNYQSFIYRDDSTFGLRYEAIPDAIQLISPEGNPAFAAPAAGTWMHLSGVYDTIAGTVKLYLGTSLKGSAATARGGQTATTLSIGHKHADNSGNGYLKGVIAYGYLYDMAPTGGQIAQNDAYLKTVAAARGFTY